MESIVSVCQDTILSMREDVINVLKVLIGMDINVKLVIIIVHKGIFGMRIITGVLKSMDVKIMRNGMG